MTVWPPVFMVLLACVAFGDGDIAGGGAFIVAGVAWSWMRATNAKMTGRRY